MLSRTSTLLAAGLAAGLILAADAALGQEAPAAAPGSHAAHQDSDAPASTGRSAGRKDAQLYIGWPTDGAVVGTRFKVWFGLRNFGVAPAGVARDATGHHHILIDTKLTKFDEPIPSDKQHLHFGSGQTETYLELPPGRHTLQLVLGDANHIPHDPPIVSKVVTITVQARRGSPQVSAR
ncbi:DUF4399 domain-containing protein [Azospirillum doebereinerae]|uniref:DUF4399 domain-containing protein n=1 Tax=Azospirillum doebereinerae TaxID=92933 RepID=A0A3S0V2E4_9PROT|nr:DUF4399 domain-containing protein [Azospirillum doebereinerae]RUQ60427.1 DUF4399 domain-containing protein [Azospirillum doebereinerae]